ncbi:MAG: hypothetical protein R8J85_09335 [Mariprofundales bacterium]
MLQSPGLQVEVRTQSVDESALGEEGGNHTGSSSHLIEAAMLC